MSITKFPDRRVKSESAKGDDLGSAGPPPYDGDMEARITRLEEFAGEARERLARVETKLDSIGHDVSQFRWWMAGSAVAIILAVVAAVLGTGVAIQQMTVATFQAAAAAAPPPAAQPLPPIIINVPSAAPAAAPVPPPQQR